MNALWAYFWPIFAAGLMIGGIAGLIGFRRRGNRAMTLTIGIAAALASAALWHWPLGAAGRFTAHVERTARQALDYYEMTKVTAHLHRRPLTRMLVLSGPADDFQTSELVRLMSQLPGVSRARWTDQAGGAPLLVEAAGVSLAAFLLGLLLAYLIDLRRRYNAQWTW
jgi:hypothetical protein